MKLDTNPVRSLVKALSIFGVASALMVTAVSGQIAIDEFGNSIGIPPGVMGPDPSGPGIGLPGPVLVFPLTFGVVPGDLLLADVSTNGNLIPSDVIRFWNPAGDPTKSFLIFYSDRPEPGEIPPPADTGLPLQFQLLIAGPFVETGTEAFNFYDYTPLPGMPGAPLVAPGPLTYHIVSDGVVPEPSTASLAFAASGFLILLKRRFQTAR